MLVTRSPVTHAVGTQNRPGAKDTAMVEAKPLLSGSSQARTQSTRNWKQAKTEEFAKCDGTERKKHPLVQGGVKEGFREEGGQMLGLTTGAGFRRSRGGDTGVVQGGRRSM